MIQIDWLILQKVRGVPRKLANPLLFNFKKMTIFETNKDKSLNLKSEIVTVLPD